MRNVAILAGAVLAFALSFVLALHVHFPGDAARDRISWELQRGTDGQWLLEAGGASLYRLTGLTLEDAVLFKKDRVRRGRGADTEPGEQQVAATPVLRVDELSVRARVLPLLRGEQSAAFAAELYGGSLDGDATVTETTQALRLLVEDVDLSRVPLEGDEWSVDATGKLQLDADVFYDTENLKKSDGTIKLEIADLVFQEATIMGMTLEPTPFSKAVLALDLGKGRAEVEEGHFQSDPVDIRVEGEIVLNKTFTRSRLKLKLLVRFNEQFDRLARMAPQLKSARDEEGTYHFRVTGTLDNPRLREERKAPRTRTRAPTVGRRGPDTDDLGADDADEESAEERRARRRERIEARRKRMMERRKARDGDVAPRDPGSLLREGRPPMPGDPRLDDVDDRDLPPGIPRIRDLQGGPVNAPDMMDDEFIDDLPPDEYYDDGPQGPPDGEFGPAGDYPDDYGPDDYGDYPPEDDFGPDEY